MVTTIFTASAAFFLSHNITIRTLGNQRRLHGKALERLQQLAANKQTITYVAEYGGKRTGALEIELKEKTGHIKTLQLHISLELNGEMDSFVINITSNQYGLLKGTHTYPVKQYTKSQKIEKSVVNDVIFALVLPAVTGDSKEIFYLKWPKLRGRRLEYAGEDKLNYNGEAITAGKWLSRVVSSRGVYFILEFAGNFEIDNPMDSTISVFYVKNQNAVVFGNFDGVKFILKNDQ